MAGAVGAGAFALGAKESAAVLPLLIMVWDRARFGETESWRTSLTRSAPFWGLLGVWLLLRAAVLAGGASEHDVSAAWMVQGAAFAAKIVTSAAMHSMWPAGLAIDYAWPMELSVGAAVAVAASAVLVIAGIGWLARLDRAAAWCGVWFLVSLLPTLALPLITRLALYQEHRVYLAEIGAAWLVGGLVRRAAQWAGTRVALRGVGAAVVIALATVAVRIDGERTWVWGDTVRLWNDALARYPAGTMGRGERGTWLVNDGRMEDAEQEFLAVLQSMPTYSYAHLMLGTIYAKRGESVRAVAAYRTALEFQSRYAEARIRLGLAYEDLGWADQALEEYERALEDDPWASPAVILSASIMDAQGRTDEAIARLRRVPPDDPVFDEAQIRLGALLVKQERWTDARDTLTGALARRPDSAETRVFLDAAIAESKRRDPLPAGPHGAPR
jgi:tetratricopeptide (TPR) repeat protein